MRTEVGIGVRGTTVEGGDSDGEASSPAVSRAAPLVPLPDAGPSTAAVDAPADADADGGSASVTDESIASLWT